MNEILFLNSNLVFGSNRLDIFNKMGTKAKLTDFAILMGADSDKDKNGFYWIKSKINKDNLNDEEYKKYIESYNIDSDDFPNRTVATRPMLAFFNNGELSNIKTNEYGVDTVEYGTYPQDIVSSKLQEKLENEYQKNLLFKTNNIFTTYQSQYTECVYDGSRYIRIEIDNNNYNKNVVWIEVLPIRWLVDYKNKLLLSEKLIFAGNENDKRKNRHNFIKDIKIYDFMNTYFLNEIKQNVVTKNTSFTKKYKK